MGYQLLLLNEENGAFPVIEITAKAKKIPSLRAEIARPYNFKKIRE